MQIGDEQGRGGGHCLTISTFLMITGATGTCGAVQRFLNDRLAAFRRAAEAILSRGL